jgi:hypothetical protein
MGFNYRAITGSTKISNNTDAFAIMAGSRPTIGQGSSTRAAMRRAQATPLCNSTPGNPRSIAEQRDCLRTNYRLSVNPVGSGGVGRMSMILYR